MDMKYSSFEEYINSNSQSSMTEEMYNEFNKLLELKVQLENEERLAEAEKEEWQELLEDLDNV